MGKKTTKTARPKLSLPGKRLGAKAPQSQGVYRESTLTRVSKEFALWVREEAKRQSKDSGERVTITDVTQQLYEMLAEGGV